MASKTKDEPILADPVHDWRLFVLTEAHVHYDEAIKLARGDADLHKMVETKEAGCPDALLLEIYL
jgi:hypothetical protein